MVLGLRFVLFMLLAVVASGIFTLTESATRGGVNSRPAALAGRAAGSARCAGRMVVWRWWGSGQRKATGLVGGCGWLGHQAAWTEAEGGAFNGCNVKPRRTPACLWRRGWPLNGVRLAFEGGSGVLHTLPAPCQTDVASDDAHRGFQGSTRVDPDWLDAALVDAKAGLPRSRFYSHDHAIVCQGLRKQSVQLSFSVNK